jgi:hypothetical protein
LREFEETCGSRLNRGAALNGEVLRKLKTLLSEADGAAPVVPVGSGEKAERQRFCFVETAAKLTPNPSPKCDGDASEAEDRRGSQSGSHFPVTCLGGSGLEVTQGCVTDRPARGGGKYGRNRCGGGPRGYQSACQQSPENGTRCGWPLRSTQTVAGR